MAWFLHWSCKPGLLQLTAVPDELGVVLGRLRTMHVDVSFAALIISTLSLQGQFFRCID